MEMEKRYIPNKMSAVNGIATQTLSFLATTSTIERDQEAEDVVEKCPSKLVAMDTAITSVRTSTSLTRRDKKILSSTSTSGLVVQDECNGEVDRTYITDVPTCDIAELSVCNVGATAVGNSDKQSVEYQALALQLAGMFFRDFDLFVLLFVVLWFVYHSLFISCAYAFVSQRLVLSHFLRVLTRSLFPALAHVSRHCFT